MAYITIEGVQYERELLVLAIEHTDGKDQEALCKEGIEHIFNYAAGSEGLTDIEMRTLEFIHEIFPFADKAKEDFEYELAKLQSAEAQLN